MTISHVWFGHGSALFLELGTLSESKRRDGSLGNAKGEVTVMADFGWRIENQRSIACASGDSKRRWASIAERLVGASVSAAEVVGRIPELQLTLSNKLWLVTSTHYQGQPTWAVLFNAEGSGALGVKGGHLYVDMRNA